MPDPLRTQHIVFRVPSTTALLPRVAATGNHRVRRRHRDVPDISCRACRQCVLPRVGSGLSRLRTASSERYTAGNLASALRYRTRRRTYLERTDAVLRRKFSMAALGRGSLAMARRSLAHSWPCSPRISTMRRSMLVPRALLPVEGDGAVTRLPVRRRTVRGESSEAADACFMEAWSIVRPLPCGRAVPRPRICST